MGAAATGATWKPPENSGDASHDVESSIHSDSDVGERAGVMPPTGGEMGHAGANSAWTACELAAVASDVHGQNARPLADGLIKRSSNAVRRRVVGDSAGAMVRRRQMR